MKASELRVGNFLFDSVEDIGVIQVTEIKNMVDNRIGNMSICYYGVNGGYSTTSLEENSNNNEIDDYMIQPIPLTEEWLLKFGFKEYKDFGHKTGCFDYINFGFSYLIDTKKIRIMHKGNNMSHILQNEVHYVHQLQNLYFALTGEELKIKE